MTEDIRPAASQTETAPAAPPPEAASTSPETPEAPEAIVSALSAALQTLAATREQAAALEAQLEAAAQARSKLAEALTAAQAQRAADAARYRDLLLAAHPEVPPALVAGETIEAVEASLETAQSTVEQVRQRLEAEGARAPIPAGAPPRRAPDLSALSAAEKIAYGLAARTRGDG